MASFKLTTINDNLVLSGNAVVAVEEDGSDEWTVGSAAYETAVSYLIGSHDWKFGTAISSPTRTGDPSDGNYTDAYAKPSAALGLIWVRVDDVATDWRIVGNQIFVNADDGVTVKYVTQPDPEEWPPLFVQALNALTKAGIYEGLNEDPTEARSLRREAESYLALARSRSDREESPRRIFKSRILARRRGELTS